MPVYIKSAQAPHWFITGNVFLFLVRTPDDFRRLPGFTWYCNQEQLWVWPMIRKPGHDVLTVLKRAIVIIDIYWRYVIACEQVKR